MTRSSGWDRMLDMWRDVSVEVDTRRSRALLMLGAVALSIGSLVAANGLSTTAASQVDADLAASMLNQVVVSAAPGRPPGADVFPTSAVSSVAGLDGVETVGLSLTLSGLTPARISRTLEFDATAIDGLTLVGATSGYLEAVGQNEPADSAWMLDEGLDVAFLGSVAADELGIAVVDDPAGYVVLIDGVEYSVAGFIGDSTQLTDAVIVPYSTATALAQGDQDAVLHVRTDAGAGASVASVVRLAVRPEAPESLVASQVIDAGDLRQGVAIQMDRLVAGVGLLLLVLTVLLVSNAMVVSVNSRIREIGLRRAMGSTRASIAMLFLIEGGLVGTLGGMAGGAAASWAVVLVSAFNGWSAIVLPYWVALGAGLGLLGGLASAAYPAFRASAVLPALAVRAD